MNLPIEQMPPLCLLMTRWARVFHSALVLFSSLVCVVAQNSTPASSPAALPSIVLFAPKAPGLGDRLSIEIEGPAETMKRATADPAKVVLFLQNIPLRGLCTNIVNIRPPILTNLTNQIIERYITNAVATNAEIFVSDTSGYSFHFEPKTIDVITTNRTSVTNAIVGTNVENDRFDFNLERSDANRSEWTALLGRPRTASKSVSLQLAVQSDNVLSVLNPIPVPITLTVLPQQPFFTSKPIRQVMAILCGACGFFLLIWISSRRHFSALFDRLALLGWLVLCVSVFCVAGPSWCWVVVAVLFILGFYYLAEHTEMLRDSGPEPDKPALRPYSLARTQMAIWFFLIVSAYVFLWLATRSLDTITATSLTLMGIGAGTALGAAAQDSSKINALKAKKAKIDATPVDQHTPEDRETLDRYELVTLDVDAAKEEQCNLHLALSKIDNRLGDIAHKLNMESVVTNRRTQLEAIQQRTQQEDAELAKLKEFLTQVPIWRAEQTQLQKDRLPIAARIQRINQLLSQRPISKGLLADVLTDEVGISFHRFQMFVWTIVLSIIFITSVYDQLAMPEFSATLLALMGISSGTYLGFMMTEPPASSDPSANATK